MMRLPFARRRRSGAARAYARAKLPTAQTPWRQVRFATVDLELTGLDPRRDEIISFAAVPVVDGRIAVGASHAVTVQPQRMPRAETIRIHGLRPADLTGAPPLAEVLDGMLEALTGRIVVAHPAWVERDFLSSAFKAAGVRLTEPIICTATLAGRVLGPSNAARGGTERSLAEVAGALGLPAHAAHTAEGDALTTAQVFIALATRLDRRQPQTLGSLARLSRSGREIPIRDGT